MIAVIEVALGSVECLGGHAQTRDPRWNGLSVDVEVRGVKSVNPNGRSRNKE